MTRVTRRCPKSAYFFPHRSEALRLGPFFNRLVLGGNAMLSFDSYRDVLSEHARGHHFVKSAWFVVVAVAVFLIVFG
jgi:hypothetical protein